MIKSFQRIFFGRYDKTRVNPIYSFMVYGGKSLYLFEQNCCGKFCHPTKFYRQTLIKITRKKTFAEENLYD